MTNEDRRFLALALEEARTGRAEGGVPIGAVLVRGGEVVSRGHNRRVQDGNPILHGEMAAFAAAGRQRSYRDTTLYTTLSPCMMCTGTIIQFGVPRVVVGEAANFAGFPDVLRAHGVEVVLADDPDCRALMAAFIRDNPALWNEDIAE
jgi:cytosine deaminase